LPDGVEFFEGHHAANATPIDRRRSVRYRTLGSSY